MRHTRMAMISAVAISLVTSTAYADENASTSDSDGVDEKWRVVRSDQGMANRKMRNAGIVLTTVGLTFFAVGLTVLYVDTHDHNDVAVVGALVGLPAMVLGGASTLVGIPLWIVGGRSTNSARLGPGFQAMPEIQIGPKAASLRWTF